MSKDKTTLSFRVTARNEEAALGKSIAWQIKRHRIRKKWSQQKLADVSGIDRARLTRIENGLANISFRTLTLITTAMELRIKIELPEDKPQPLIPA